MYHFLQVFYCSRVCISSRFRDNWPRKCRGHDLDRSRSRTVMVQVTNRFAIGYFLIVVHCPQVSISKLFLRYLHLNISGSRSWPFRVTWRHRSLWLWLFDTPYAFSYRCSVVTEAVSPVVFEIMGPNILGSRPWPFQVTWRHRSCDQSIRLRPFPVGCSLERSLYL